MSFNYINEAFKQLSLLNEDSFDVSLKGLNDLSDFMDSDKTDDITKVIDTNAEDEVDLADSYVGKVIINCNVCHSHIFENKEDIVIDEDDVVNPEMVCPYCGETSGFTIVGEITSYAPAKTDEESKDDSDVDQEVDKDEQLSESLDSDIKIIKNFMTSKGYDCSSKEAVTYLWGVIDLLNAGNIEVNKDNLEDWYKETQQNFPEDFDVFKTNCLEEDLSSVEVSVDNNTVEVSSEDSDIEIKVNTDKEEDEECKDCASEITQTSSDTTSVNNTDVDSSKEVNIDIDEFEETKMDDLVENFFKDRYSNIKSFKTTRVSTDDSRMVVEGKLAFNSGKEKTTGFVFENFIISNNKKVKCTGKNSQIDSGKNSIELRGKINGSKFIPESLKYKGQSNMSYDIFESYRNTMLKGNEYKYSKIPQQANDGYSVICKTNTFEKNFDKLMKESYQLDESYGDLPSWFTEYLNKNDGVKRYLSGRNNIDLHNAVYVKGEMPKNGWDPAFRDDTKLPIFLLKETSFEDDGSVVYIVNVNDPEVYVDSDRPYKPTRVSYLSKKQLLDLAIEYGYIDFQDSRNSNRELKLQRKAQKAGSVDRLPNAQYTIKKNKQFGRKEDNTRYLVSYDLDWVTVPGYDKSGYKLDPNKYIKKLYNVNLDDYSIRLEMMYNKIEDARKQLIDVINSIDIKVMSNCDIGYSIKEVTDDFSDIIKVYTNLQYNIDSEINSGEDGDVVELGIKNEFKIYGKVFNKSLSNFKKSLTKLNTVISEYQE